MVAQVARGGVGGVIDVLRVGVLVAVTVDPELAQVLGMNCIGPTARSQTTSPSYRPPSVSGIAANGPPSSTGPKIAGPTLWSLRISRPPADPDSIWPMAASRATGRRHALGAASAAEW